MLLVLLLWKLVLVFRTLKSSTFQCSFCIYWNQEKGRENQWEKNRIYQQDFHLFAWVCIQGSLINECSILIKGAGFLQWTFYWNCKGSILLLSLLLNLDGVPKVAR